MKEKETSKLYNSITNVNNQFIEEAQTTKKNKNNWIKWVVTAAACLTLICVCLLVGSDVFNEQRHIRKTFFRFL